MELILNGKEVRDPYSIYFSNKTFNDLLQFADEDLSCELIDGVLVIKSPASFTHESIFLFLITLLKLYGRKHNLGTPIGSRFIMRLAEDWGPEPDIMFLTPSDQERLQEHYLDGPASVVFEILSKSNRKTDVQKKTPQYLHDGVQEVWLIDPKKKQIQLIWPDDSTLIENNEWASSRVIPGFQVNSSWLWVPNSKDETEALAEIEEKRN
ncbi:MAG TPA: Uma2 family endonuclease [Candidatus Lokiarchaeia archaeon]|nr:Uma2 family endonuclease [Candidatus Lokiarchaeia archaeon]